mmetsp:Transcript_28406/g.58128  ORF Transcript_28406/g.58128 Transcript_28406/m.58128 type:complete len:137 (+) Transcript_28406:184-594(+)|eukprot:CAMPEP_0171595598 /NCGR_PEP_ID=MMETSP0990-20121206/1429_1 /TAXON_ID=483369 /ORGANISM="non described non described, Strain CCMP2098" /LENGTH=136 /DNA_ID=CAMNT_0012156607 /DNA_START=136 /DNA_END=546 /DNA_ORIENTATION=-
MELVNEVVYSFRTFVVHNGWRLVALGVAWYFLSEPILKVIAEKERAAGLASANDPERVAVLSQERKRTRAEQQRRAEQEAVQTRERVKREKGDRELKQRAFKESRPGYNPLDGDSGSGGGRRPIGRPNLSECGPRG